MKNEKTPLESYALKIAADIEAQAALLRLDIESKADICLMRSRLTAIENFSTRGQASLDRFEFHSRSA